ncbi:hypothetical protein FOZ63_012444, partial [Perkinsus olseni]
FLNLNSPFTSDTDSRLKETPTENPGKPCIVGDASPSSESSAAATGSVEDGNGKLIMYIVGGTFGAIVIGSILMKYQALGEYTSFWARILALGLAGASGGFGAVQYR